MSYSKSGKIATLEENGLKVQINYDDVIAKIDKEISNSDVYITGEEEKNLYYFGKKGVTKEDYINSLVKIKGLIKEIFNDSPSFNIFDFISVTKKGKFQKNRKVHLAAPIVGLIYNYDYYKYLESLCLEITVIDENTAEVYWHYVQSDINKFDPIFFEDYTKPIIKEKLKAIKKADLKIGMIYSDEKQKKFFLYLGNANLLASEVLKQSTSLLDKTSFTNEDIEQEVKKIIDEKNKHYAKFDETYNPNEYLYIKLSKKEYEKLIKGSKTKDFNEFWDECIENGMIFKYEKPLRVFHEECQYLVNVKPLKKIFIGNTRFINNISGPIFYAGLPKDTFTSCSFRYLSY